MTDTTQPGADNALDLDKLEALESAATPGPWDYREADGISAIAHPLGWVLESGDEQECADKRFIVAAKNAMPALIALARRAAQPVEPTDEQLQTIQRRVWSALDRKACPGVWLQLASDAIFGFKTDSYGSPLATHPAEPAVPAVGGEVILMARSPEGDPWQEVSTDDFIKANANGYETSIHVVSAGKNSARFEIVGPVSGALVAKDEQDQAHVMPPFAAPASQHDAGASVLTDERIIEIRNAVGERYNSAAHVSASGAIEFARRIISEVSAPETPEGFTPGYEICGACEGTGYYAPGLPDECEDCKGDGEVQVSEREWK